MARFPGNLKACLLGNAVCSNLIHSYWNYFCNQAVFPYRQRQHGVCSSGCCNPELLAGSDADYRIFPASEMVPLGGDAGWRSLVLPVITLGTGCMASITRITRSSMLEVVRQDYIRTAKAKGVSSRVVIYKHALKNALIPVVTVVGLQFGSLLGGAVLTESVFSWPGVGTYLVNSIKAKDTPAVLGCVIIFCICFSIVNLVVDILYAYIDPRIKSKYK